MKRQTQNDTNAALLPATPTSQGDGETVEEAATKAGAEYYRKDKPANTYTFHEGFKQGAQWQSQHSQSLDIRSVLEYVGENCLTYSDDMGVWVDKDAIFAMQPEIEKMLKEK